MSANPASGEFIFETIQLGQSQKLSAIDVATGIEVSIVVPPHTNKSYARKIAARKLIKRLQRENKGTGGGGITA